MSAQNGHQPVRVLWVQDKLGYGDSLHGGGRYFLSVLSQFAPGEAVAVVLRPNGGGLVDYCRQHGVPVRLLRHPTYGPRTLWALVRLIWRERIQVLHLHGHGASTFGYLAGWLTRTPVVVHQHDSVAEVPWYCRLADRWLGRGRARMIAVSEPVKRFCVTRRSMRPEQVIVVHHGVAPATGGAGGRESQRRALGLPLDVPLIGSVTRFHPEKGVTVLLDAMAEVVQRAPRAHLVLWGDGPERQALEAQAARLGLAEQVHFMGFDPDATAHLGCLDLFVLPSLNEGLGLALLEALAAGLPIVATNVGGIPEVVSSQEAVLVPGGDAVALAEGLTQVLLDQRLSDRLRKASQLAATRFTMERHLETLRRVYREAAAR